MYVVYKWYILPIGWLYATYHLLREPGNSIKEEHPVQKLCYENWSTRKKSGCCFRTKCMFKNRKSTWIISPQTDIPLQISQLFQYDHLFFSDHNKNTLFFPMFWHSCVAPTNRPQDSGQFMKKILHLNVSAILGCVIFPYQTNLLGFSQPAGVGSL